MQGLPAFLQPQRPWLQPADLQLQPLLLMAALLALLAVSTPLSLSPPPVAVLLLGVAAVRTPRLLLCCGAEPRTLTGVACCARSWRPALARPVPPLRPAA